ncbi:hypothetical protein [Streptomyces sp. MZ04]|uniref:hypothetical protein n=1 Tax=Streptomyces sp. MZ04 TaxID=2559236 RepID=UPI00107E8124|nr:hypothetical protein [Streptomyces sp. MZ04]TGB06028.1 hypothetical protein E2651_23960 [Streptomyces sp. MZ04]
MAEFKFELKPFRSEGRIGRKGILGDFGEVIVQYDRYSRKRRNVNGETRLFGDKLPDVSFKGSGPGMPVLKWSTLKESVLTMDSATASLVFNVNGLSNRARSLHISLMGREYQYCIGRMSRDATLSRDGVRVKIRMGEKIQGLGMTSVGEASGDFEAVDLALAIVFEEVNTSDLTATGALFTTYERLVSGKETPTD